jgi:hypothetical protein
VRTGGTDLPPWWAIATHIFVVLSTIFGIEAENEFADERLSGFDVVLVASIDPIVEKEYR